MHFKSDQRAPLLIVGAEEDHTVPASLAKKQFEKYEHSDSQTDYIEFAGRPHLMMGADDWEEIAATIEQWIEEVLDKTPVGTREASA